MNSKIYKYLLAVLASILFGMGLELCISAGYGVDPLSVLVSGFSSLTGLSFSVMSFIIYMIMALVTVLISRRHISTLTILSCFTVSIGIETAAWLLGYLSFMPSLLLFIIGLFGSAASIAWMIYLDCGKSPYDALILTIADIFHTQYHVVRWFTDLASVVTGWLLKGSFGIGTVVFLLAMGKMVDLFGQFYRKLKA
jgi:uncharacterized membrane protein YczE